MEIGLYTFAELSPETTGGGVSQEQRLRDLLEEAELAEQVGLDVFGVGEHHRPDFVVSAPAVVLAAIAARTERLRLTSAVVFRREDGLAADLTRAELARLVRAAARGPSRLGVRRGDRVAALLPNSPEAVIGLLASAAIGAFWSACSPISVSAQWSTGSSR